MTADVPGILDRSALAAAPRTLVDVLRETTHAHPDASALEDAAGALSYRELMARVVRTAVRLHHEGVRRGDRVGIRMPSGSRELYVAILGVMAAGAAYVPVDADDPDERARLVFGEADVRGVVSGGGVFEPNGGTESDAPPAGLFDGTPPHPSTHVIPVPTPPELDDDAWIIFTSGSTGTPKGVAVRHRSAAAFVDAEAKLFLQDAPLGPGDRVLAGLSVAFDASCEEMWLAWRHGACLVPAPRSLVRSGMDLGPWMVTHGITVVSTVPTLAALWPAEAIENVRLLIFGGEAVPPELAARLVSPEREVWNTYGPTEATVVACAALLDGVGPVRIGVPLDGWALAVVDPDGRPVGEGEVGELIIAGAGLARYLDAEKDAAKYSPMPTLAWERAYRSGDLVVFDPDGLLFQGRVDDQVKVGGRRIELGEIEAALQALPGVTGAAAAVRRTEAGNQVLVGYLAADGEFDRVAARARLAEELPAALVPLLAVVDELPTRTSGKVDRDALPWPLPGVVPDAAGLGASAAWLAELWQAVLGVPVSEPDASFFDLGGGSLAAAQLVSRIRARDPEFTVADIYDRPRLGAMADEVEARVSDTAGSDAATFRQPVPTPRGTQWVQTLAGVPLFILSGARWLLYLLTATTILTAVSADFAFLPTVPIWVLIVGLALFATPFGRMAIAVVGARVLLAGLEPGDYPRGGAVHLRMWLADQIAHQVDAVGLSGAPWVTNYARALGARIGQDVDLHTLPPVTGMLTIGDRAAVEPEVDLAGTWIDGDVVRIGRVRIGAGSTIGARSTLLPGARIGKRAEIAPGSAVFGRVPSGQRWAGSPAERVGPAHITTDEPPRPRRWLFAYGLSSLLLSLLPIAAFAAGGAVIAAGMAGSATLGEAALRALAWLVPATLVAGVAFAGLVVIAVRLLAIGLGEGRHPVRSRVGWQAWTTERLMDASRTILFPLYSSLFTPVWLRLLGAEVGRDVEASTVLLIPSMTTIDDHAFLADDTMVASYELQGGWMRLEGARIGKRAFLGNSGIAAAGHRLARDTLVAVLSVAPAKSKPGTSWLGSPPMRLRRSALEVDESRTYRPSSRLRIARTLWELCRIVPVFVTCAIGLGVLFTLAALTSAFGAVVALLVSGVVMLAAGAVAAIASTIAKWVFVGRIRAGEHPLWSSFVWRTEVSDTFVEMVAAPWFAQAAAGTPALAVWLRTLGARIGRGVWCDSYWLPEADLVTLGDGSTVNRGCVVQTHLFHDRIMSMDQVTLEPGATLGPHSVILPAARIGAHATVGPASLVMRGEVVPVGSRWSGNPIGPWRVVRFADYHVQVR
ncbi:Pls/PosA family non-ribosomal peptide synthetase [Agromyces sp. Soil535]|uniref:Pls/PosA family non-ribosomal peptide synthetase n=1 Tax=Agromyces sp. Soil535 TaxID=1736390 RepID=UPI0006FF3D19|nr:Pls/PosA family non-ribosomal peptide synthetase [Agromyces sp. Soil535]KRE31299.1 amino acid adenylation protein [Agromyces sp. Soil535]